jgi:cation transporter-like permease
MRSVFPPIPPLIAVMLLISVASGYGETARQLPLIVGTSTLVLILLDIVSRLPGKAGAIIRSALGAGFQDPELTEEPRWQSEAIQLVWVATCVLGILLIGILPTVPIFIFSYMFVQGGQRLIVSVIVALLVLLLIGLLFEVALDYELYRGMLFDESGFDQELAL